MDQLVAQGVDAAEDDGQQARGVLLGQGVVGGFFRGFKALPPLVFGFLAFLVIPEAGKHVAVIQQYADGVRVSVPHQLAQAVVAVQ